MLIRWLDPPDRERDGEAIAGALSRAAAILEIDQADAGVDDGVGEPEQKTCIFLRSSLDEYTVSVYIFFIAAG